MKSHVAAILIACSVELCCSSCCYILIAAWCVKDLDLPIAKLFMKGGALDDIARSAGCLDRGEWPPVGTC